MSYNGSYPEHSVTYFGLNAKNRLHYGTSQVQYVTDCVHHLNCLQSLVEAITARYTDSDQWDEIIGILNSWYGAIDLCNIAQTNFDIDGFQSSYESAIVEVSSLFHANSKYQNFVVHDRIRQVHTVRSKLSYPTLVQGPRPPLEVTAQFNVSDEEVKERASIVPQPKGEPMLLADDAERVLIDQILDGQIEAPDADPLPETIWSADALLKYDCYPDRVDLKTTLGEVARSQYRMVDANLRYCRWDSDTVIQSIDRALRKAYDIRSKAIRVHSEVRRNNNASLPLRRVLTERIARTWQINTIELIHQLRMIRNSTQTFQEHIQNGYFRAHQWGQLMSTLPARINLVDIPFSRIICMEPAESMTPSVPDFQLPVFLGTPSDEVQTVQESHQYPSDMRNEEDFFNDIEPSHTLTDFSD